MQYAHNTLRRKITVGDHSDKEGRDDPGNRQRTVSTADLQTRRMEMLAHIGSHRHIPRTPDKILDEHHERQLTTCFEFHMQLLNSDLRCDQKLQQYSPKSTNRIFSKTISCTPVRDQRRYMRTFEDTYRHKGLRLQLVE